MDNRRTFRLSDEEYSNLQQQAKQLGLNASEYIRFIISLDTSTGIIQKLKGK
jgi:predicted DNA-binding protein